MSSDTSDIQQIDADATDIQQIDADASDIQQINSFNRIDADATDIQQIKNVKEFSREFYSESKKLWYLAAPAICTLVFQYSISAITQVFAGHVGDIQLAAVSVENNLIAGFAFGVLYGMGSALETLCGQAVGARKLDMLGIYMQRSWIILAVTVIPLTSVYILTTPILKLLRQNPQIAKAAGRFTLWMIPELFAYVIIFPVQKFLQSQSKIFVMASITVVAFVGHVVFSWLFMLKLHWGLPAAAVVLNATWLFIMVAQLVYIFSGACADAWNGFSLKAFENLRGFVRLSLASGVMFCLEMWYFVALILISGYTKNAEISVDATSICINILQWTIMVGIGFNAAIRRFTTKWISWTTADQHRSTMRVAHVPPGLASVLDDGVICRVDTGFHGPNHAPAYGFIVQEMDGTFVAAGNGPLICPYDPLLAEAMALCEALSWLRDNGYSRISVCSDSLVLVSSLKHASSFRTYFGYVLLACNRLLSSMTRSTVIHVRRDDLQAAHVMAKHVTASLSCSLWRDIPPSFLEPGMANAI
ncbi:PREDICTED: protein DETOXIFICATION 29-like [Ipomoea nil]|uniref:protein DETOXIFICATION 29-like n=1 Tax=Ipomoea nil TaxID=35883 RepID=UPI0009008DE2|nr:PREDICTED: protein DETOXIFICATION 29-like [Ipomoea nil]